MTDNMQHTAGRLSEPELVAFCDTMIEKGSKSFAGASRLFATQTRRSATLLYAWCRHCDDVIDGQELGFAPAGGGATASTECLNQLRDETSAALAGDYSQPAFQALASVAERHELPARHPLDLIEGFAMDVEGRSYETTEDTLVYCYHVAGVVGVMMAMIMGVRRADALQRASDLGIAFQLTNIARDVISDAESARIYVPRELLEKHGMPQTPEALLDRQHRTQLTNAIEELLELADRYYASASLGLTALDFRSAWAIATARRVYRHIGRIVRTRGKSAWDQRASTGKLVKLSAAALALSDAAMTRTFVPGRLASSRLVRGRTSCGPEARAGAAGRIGLWTPPFLDVDAAASLASVRTGSSRSSETGRFERNS
ncbi:MAG: phytoene/squalene synthase family protein [Pseudomonadota bacterium]